MYRVIVQGVKTTYIHFTWQMTTVHMVMLAARTVNQNSLAMRPREDCRRL